MDLLLGIIILLTTVVVANVIHLLFPQVPLSLYQIIAGILIALLPTTATNFSLHPELFMMVIIAPLMFNDGQNQSFRYLSRNFRSILSISVVLALVTVIISGGLLHLAMSHAIPLALAFTIAAIITPTDAVAVKSITTNMTVPENVNGALEYESLFNDASGIVLLDLSLAAYQSGDFSLSHGLWIFVYVFFGGIIFGGLLGSLLIQLRTRLMRNHADIGSIVIPINIMTPIVIYWLAEELHFSGILAVVSAGVVHSILYDRLRLTSTKVQVATNTIWTIISDTLNGIVFVLLGVMLPQVLQRTHLMSLLKLFIISIALYLIMTALRFIWVRWHLVHIDSAPANLNRDSFLMALGGIHGTITLALAFSLPVMVNHHTFAFRNSIILIAAFVILISLLIGAVGFPLLLPPKEKSYTEEEFHQYLTATVQYAIAELRATPDDPQEKAIVVDQLSSQMNPYRHFNQNVYDRLLAKTHQVELDTIDQLMADGVITKRDANLYTHFIARNILRSSHGFFDFWSLLLHRLKWRHKRRKWQRHHPQAKQQSAGQASEHSNTHSLMTINERQSLHQILQIVTRNVDNYLRSVENTTNANEVAMIRRAYVQQNFIFTWQTTADTDLITSLFIEAFQSEHSYVQKKVAAGKISQELANALNEQISTDELVYVQSLD